MEADSAQVGGAGGHGGGMGVGGGGRGDWRWGDQGNEEEFNGGKDFRWWKSGCIPWLFSGGTNQKLLALMAMAAGLSGLGLIWCLNEAWALDAVKTGRRAAPKETDTTSEAGPVVWEVRGNTWRRHVADPAGDSWKVDAVFASEEEAMALGGLDLPEQGQRASGSRGKPGGPAGVGEAVSWVVDTARGMLLPRGFPTSVTEDYAEYTAWRMAQLIMSQINGVLTTQALLYAVGLGKGAIPTAAAINWVLRDGIGYLSKIALSKYGRNFDVHPKAWRLMGDLIENGSYALELLTPNFPHLFVPLAAAAGAGRSACGMIHAATRTCFYHGFAARQQNFAEIIAKGEAQGMASKSLGIGLGILLAGRVGHSGPALGLTFLAVSVAHVYCNFRSYQAVLLRTLNPYRAELLTAEYMRSRTVPSLADVNSAEPLIWGVPWLRLERKPAQGQSRQSSTLSETAKAVANSMAGWVELGASLGASVDTRADAQALLHMYEGEGYILLLQGDRAKVVLKEGSSQRDMLRAVVQATYLHQRMPEEGGPPPVTSEVPQAVKESHEWMKQNFEPMMALAKREGWVGEGLLSRPGPRRICIDGRK